MKKFFLLIPAVLLGLTLSAQADLKALIDQRAAAIESKVIQWRRHFHENPELSNREFKTAEIVEKHLRSLGLEVRTKIAYTGVVGILKGGKPGPVVALRADMDALPVTERVNIPFASKVKATYLDQEVGVMHACGHDTHMAMLMGAAEVLAGMREQIPGTIVFIFQPAEEGPPRGEEGGAELMVKEGVLKNPKVEAAFGIHIGSYLEVGRISYKPGGTMAAVNELRITVKGKGSHGSAPWSGIDPIVTAAQIITNLQHIVSREMELTKEAAVVTIGMIRGGTRSNIIPESVELIGTIRTLDTAMQRQVHAAIRRIVTNVAEAHRAEATVDIAKGYPVTYNNPELTEKMVPTLKAVAGADKVHLVKATTGAEDFSFFAQEVPGLFVFLGGMPKGQDGAKAAPHHTPDFYIDESGLTLGVRTYARLALDYMLSK